MRRIYIFPLLLLMSLTAVMVVAQDDPPPDSPVDFGSTPETKEANENYFTSLNNGPLIISSGEGADLCVNAPSIDSGQGGTQMDVAALTQSSDDPILNCMWGSPSSTKGYRTVWYQFTPTANGIMTLSTLPSFSGSTNSYDTVLAVHTGSCGSLETVACNDDLIGFSSTLTMHIRRNTTYYIEVADWQAGGNAIKMLDLSLQIEQFDTNWQTISSQPPTLTSRHASVVIDSNIYFLGGRGAGGAILNDFQKLDTETGTWENVIPGIPDGGLLNTTAVHLPSTNSIYMPGGSIQSSDQAYSRDHQIYDFETGIWTKATELVGSSYVTETFAYAAAAPNNANDGYFLTGGIVGPSLVVSSTVRDQVLFYQPASDTWFERKEMLSPRYGHVAANIGGNLCVAGGLNTDGSANVLIPNGECASGVSPSTWFPTGNMKIPRYYAHSSVGPDGKWYVYGGIDGSGTVVPEVEFYDPATNEWAVLGLLYDLGGQNGKPLVWPGGGFVGNYLWAAGGSFDPTGNNLNPQVARVQILEGSIYLPLILNNTNANNHSFANALNVPINKTISQNFSDTRTLVNVYKFDLNQVSTVNVTLASVAASANLNLYLYGDNKDLIQSDESPFPGINKTITLPLGPGTYYVVVRYLFSPDSNDINDYYQLRVSQIGEE